MKFRKSRGPATGHHQLRSKPVHSVLRVLCRDVAGPGRGRASKRELLPAGAEGPGSPANVQEKSHSYPETKKIQVQNQPWGILGGLWHIADAQCLPITQSTVHVLKEVGRQCLKRKEKKKKAMCSLTHIHYILVFLDCRSRVGLGRGVSIGAAVGRFE